MVTSSAPISPGSGSSRQRTATASPPSTPLQAIFKPPSPSPQNGSFPPSPSPLQKSFEGAAGATSLPRRQSATRVQSPLRPGVLRSTTDPNATPANKGKRKADDDIERTPPEERERKEKQRTTFAPDPRVQRISNTDSSHAPSSYHRKRPRVSNQTASSSSSRPAITEHPSRDGSWTSRSSAPPNAIRPPSRTKSTRSDRRAMSPAAPADEREDSRSGVSIPISALISPHAPSIVSTPGQRSSYHMRDPRRPRVRPTPWALSFGAGEDGLGSPVQAWMFFIGFILFPLWWLASVWRIPETRSVGGHDAAEKAVVVDDPQIEHDARTWRFRCRIMAAISLVTYIPFIVLVAIFAPR
ncbi:hypothetical protein PUNSTDRAFT_81670 [Punctularia strigosozonata HHB-11173 SS5]|uniref:uncharacterized protein n=1 Tax=Punctularia strigosozonata (strain HHB-11173) TaxID=741275 RepID=UPI00044168BD|nr:uncharacterized protein PUNSTDRAFT_81670 [Punctularia strigosozonata HHB-11173 SS5]EIN12437.1 hypothetical protein PUNSTDRAFT_81670 [Punctularia strigosozonata HHB-11173 SS5]